MSENIFHILLIGFAILVIVIMESFGIGDPPSSDGYAEWYMPRYERVKEQWVEVCPHCGRQYGGE